MDESPQATCPLAALGTAVSQLLGRAVGACLAASGTSDDRTVSLELAQCPQAPGLLGLRVCDDGLPLPADADQLERCMVNLQLEQLLARPLFSEHTLLVQTTGLEEVVLRRYSARPIDGGQQLGVHEEGLQPKPPGTSLCGTVVEATVRLQELLPPMGEAAAGLCSGGSSSASEELPGVSGARQLPASAEACVESLQQLMEMLRALAPPVRLLMRLSGVLLQAPDGSLQPVSGSRRMDLPLGGCLTVLLRFRAGLASAYLPSSPPEAEAELATATGQQCCPPVLGAPPGVSARDCGLRAMPPGAVPGMAAATAAVGAGSSEAARSHGAGGAVFKVRQPAVSLAGGAAGGEAGAEAAASTASPGASGTALQYLTLLGVGEAGWGGCAEGHYRQPSRASKWTAQAGVVLQLPDLQLQLPPSSPPPGSGQPGSAEGRDGNSSRAGRPSAKTDGCSAVVAPAVGAPVFFFRSWSLVPATGEQQAAARRGLERCEWASFGLRMDEAAQDSPGAGPLAAAIKSAVPASGLRLAAIVLHVLPREYHYKQGRAAPALSVRSEALLIRQALQGALHQLKQQRPEVMYDRAERSLSATLPWLSKGMTGILLQSARHGVEGSALEEACAAVGCNAEELQGKLLGLLRHVARMPGSDCGSAGAEQEGGGPADGSPTHHGDASELMQAW